VFLLANRQPVGRLGIAATKKLGGSVQRNRAKRLIREVFRRNKVAPGFDVVVIPKRELLDAALTALEAEYRTLVERRLRKPAATAAVAGGPTRTGGHQSI
jgi:ribonuclease P protein component